MSSILIQVKRGDEKYIPNLNEGEFGFTLDTKKLYIGDGTSNIEIYTNASALPYVKKTGDTMTGNLIIGDVSNAANTAKTLTITTSLEDTYQSYQNYAFINLESIGSAGIGFSSTATTGYNRDQGPIGLSGYFFQLENDDLFCYGKREGENYPRQIFSCTDTWGEFHFNIQNKVIFTPDRVMFGYMDIAGGKLYSHTYNTTNTYIYMSGGDQFTLYDITVNRNHQMRIEYYHEGQIFYVILRNGGSRTLTWSFNGNESDVHWDQGVEPAWTPSGVDIICFFSMPDGFIVGSRIFENV